MSREQKTCTKCQVPQPLTNFYKKTDRPGKLFARCKDCTLKEQKNESRTRYVRNNPTKWMLFAARNRAKKNGWSFDLEEKDIVIPEFCPVLGIKLEYKRGTGVKRGDVSSYLDSPSLDRIKPELGYVKGNVMVISYRANVLKSNATISELEKVIQYMKDTE